jgi:hypothetical protein
MEGDVGSLRDLLALGKPQQCSFEQTEDEVRTAGTILVADGRMRADFATSADGVEQAGHMIVKDETVFIWLDGQANGMTMALNFAAEDKQDNQGPLNFEARNVEYDCRNWRENSFVFNQPANIEFVDLSAMLGASAESAGDAQCAVCDQLSGSQKDQCRLALQCS